MKNKKLVSLALTMALCMTLANTAVAAEISTAGGDGAAQVTLTAEATTFNVTVPTTIPINVDANGIVTTPEINVVAITNNSFGQVKVSSVTAVGATPAGGSAWTITDYNNGDKSIISDLPVDSNKVAIAFTPYKAADTVTPATVAGTQIATADDTGVMTISTPNDWVIDGTAGAKPVLQLKTDAITTAVSSTQATAHIANIVFVIGWNK